MDIRRREEKTLDIATALLVFVGLLVAGGVVLWFLDLGPGTLRDNLAMPLVVVASAVAVRYLLTRPR